MARLKAEAVGWLPAAVVRLAGLAVPCRGPWLACCLARYYMKTATVLISYSSSVGSPCPVTSG